MTAPIFTCDNSLNWFPSLSTGYIDLSKRRVSPEEAIKCEDKFTKSKTVSFRRRANSLLSRIDQFKFIYKRALTSFTSLLIHILVNNTNYSISFI